MHVLYHCPQCGTPLATAALRRAAFDEDTSLVKCLRCDALHHRSLWLDDDNTTHMALKVMPVNRQLITVRYNAGTYVASYGKSRASCTEGSQAAASRLADKLGTDAVAHFIMRQGEVDYYDLESDETEAGEIAA